MQLILASKSPHRAKLLSNAGLNFETYDSKIDERSVELALGNEVAADDRALILAQTKAITVSENAPNAVVIGCDQILCLDDEILHKPADFEAARAKLLKLSGKTHTLFSAVALAKHGKVIWSAVIPAYMTMRKLDPAYIGRYLAFAGSGVLSSAGCYQIEETGIQLFEKMDGDYFAIIGLPLLPLLAELRAQGAIDG